MHKNALIGLLRPLKTGGVWTNARCGLALGRVEVRASASDAGFYFVFGLFCRDVRGSHAPFDCETSDDATCKMIYFLDVGLDLFNISKVLLEGTQWNQKRENMFFFCFNNPIYWKGAWHHFL